MSIASSTMRMVPLFESGWGGVMELAF
jgi:hypothetical protein